MPVALYRRLSALAAVKTASNSSNGPFDGSNQSRCGGRLTQWKQFVPEFRHAAVTQQQPHRQTPGRCRRPESAFPMMGYGLCTHGIHHGRPSIVEPPNSPGRCEPPLQHGTSGTGTCSFNRCTMIKDPFPSPNPCNSPPLPSSKAGEGGGVGGA